MPKPGGKEHLPRQETFSFGHCPNYQKVGHIFLNVKNDVLARITEPSNDDYDNDVSDNRDHDMVFLMILVSKITKKYHII